MSLADYFRVNAGEMLLAIASAWCMAMVGFCAFFTEASPVATPIPFVVVAVLIAILYASSYKKTWFLKGGVAYLVLVAVLVLVGIATSTNATPFADEEGSNLYFVLVMVVSATACFLLTRTLAGSAVWLVAVVFLCSVVQAFYQADQIAFSVAASGCALALVVGKNFKIGWMEAASAGRVSSLGNLAASVAPVLAAAGLGLAVWFAIIAPLNPGVAHITLLTDYRQLPIEYAKGTAQIQPEYNTDMTTDQLEDGERYTTDDLLEGESDDTLTVPPEQQQSSDETAEGGGSATGSRGVLDDESIDQVFNALSYSLTFPYVLILIGFVLLIVGLIAAFFVLRRKRRVARLEKMLAGSPEDQVKDIYRFLLSRMARIGYKVPAGVTLVEYARNQRRRMDGITAETKVAFSDLTDTYVACAYGHQTPTSQQIVPFVAFYLAFWKAARKELGSVRYFFRSFRL